MNGAAAIGDQIAWGVFQRADAPPFIARALHVSRGCMTLAPVHLAADTLSNPRRIAPLHAAAEVSHDARALDPGVARASGLFRYTT